MTPIYISGCFGVLHPAAGPRGVLICSTMGDEALNVYRPLTFLADRFAAAGSPTLRLEYYGTGDSAGEDGESGRFQAWLNGIAAGARWLRDACGVQSITLVGVRVGAALAARAACEIDNVESLVLLSPMPSGRRFLREMILRARTTADIWQVESRIEDGGWFEAHGMRLDRPTRDALDRLDMAKIPCCPAPQALVLDEPDAPAAAVVVERLQHLGTSVTGEGVDGIAEMLRDPYENTVPHDAFARAVAWHQSLRRDNAAAAGDAAAGCGKLIPLTVTQAADTVAATDILLTAHAREEPIRFGPDDSLFGILSLPLVSRAGAPPVLIANTGANPRSGNSRGATLLARWLAANGIASLRMDGAGIGDSALATGERGVPYSAQGDLDVVAGVDALARRCTAPILLMGMCSGAFHALRVAFDDRRVGGVMLVNLQKFSWQAGESLSVVQRTTFRTTRFYLRHVLSSAVWRRLMHGEINVGGITRALAGRALRRVAAASDPAVAMLQRQETQVGRIRRKLRDMRKRNVPVLFVLSGNDPGLDEIAEYFGANGRQLRRQPHVMFRIVEGADHTLSSAWARDALRGLMATFLRQRCSLVLETDAVTSPGTGAMRSDAGFSQPAAIDSTTSAA